MHTLEEVREKIQRDIYLLLKTDPRPLSEIASGLGVTKSALGNLKNLKTPVKLDRLIKIYLELKPGTKNFCLDFSNLENSGFNKVRG